MTRTQKQRMLAGELIGVGSVVTRDVPAGGRPVKPGMVAAQPTTAPLR